MLKYSLEKGEIAQIHILNNKWTGKSSNDSVVKCLVLQSPVNLAKMIVLPIVAWITRAAASTITHNIPQCSPPRGPRVLIGELKSITGIRSHLDLVDADVIVD